MTTSLRILYGKGMQAEAVDKCLQFELWIVVGKVCPSYRV